MDRILTVDDWWDGPRLGLATLENIVYVIYERIFSETLDAYTEFYHLTPVDAPTAEVVLNCWKQWIQWMQPDPSADRAAIWEKSGSVDLKIIAKNSFDYHKYYRRAAFSGVYHNAYCEPEHYFVTWCK